MAKAKPPETVTITYDLFDLPTAQHKAGLAGLLLQIDHMNGRRPKSPTPRIVERTAISVTIEFTAETTQSLLDDLYDAQIVEAKVKSKWQGATLKREEAQEVETPDGKTKTVKLFVYDVVRPSGHFLQQHLPAMEADKDWHKLWRDMLWVVPRGNPQSRQAFEQRAAGEPCKEGASSWTDLQKVSVAASLNAFHTDEVASSLWMGAQATNAESIPFRGRAEHTLLLHFWPLTTLIYVPQAVQPDGGSEFVGFVLAIPEVSNLDSFLADYPLLLAGLSTDIRGFRPADAVIDLPAQGALSFFRHLHRLAADRAAGTEVRYAVSAVECLHQVKLGNNVKTIAATAVALRPHLLEDYLAIAGRVGEKAPYGNPLFRRALLLALLEDKPWFQPFGKLFAEWDVSFFVRTAAPSKLSWFWADARKKIQERIQAMPTDQLPDADDLLMMLIHRLARTYLTERAKRKSGIDPEKFRDGDKIPWDKLPKDFHDSRREVGESLFLEFRSRREQAFIEHFAQTFFATKQYLSEDHYAEIGRALLHRTEDVKTLTLMALSANS